MTFSFGEKVALTLCVLMLIFLLIFTVVMIVEFFINDQARNKDNSGRSLYSECKSICEEKGETMDSYESGMSWGKYVCSCVQVESIELVVKGEGSV